MRIPSRLVVVLMTASILASCSTAPVPGTQGGACYGNGTCDDGLSCASDFCVKVEDGGEGDGRIGGTGRIFKGRPRSPPGKNALLFMFAVG